VPTRHLCIHSHYLESTSARRHPSTKHVLESALGWKTHHICIRSRYLENTSVQGRLPAQRSGIDDHSFERLSHCPQQ
jgi:hypothetical protein